MWAEKCQIGMKIRFNKLELKEIFAQTGSWQIHKVEMHIVDFQFETLVWAKL